MTAMWMPPDMLPCDADKYAEMYPNDPHRAAAAAWEAYASTLPATPAVQSVSTGDQSVSYSTGGGAFDAAMQRANWHLSRSRAYSTRQTTVPTIGVRDSGFGWLEGGLDWEDRGIIQTVLYPPEGTLP